MKADWAGHHEPKTDDRERRVRIIEKVGAAGDRMERSDRHVIGRGG